jgi:hypothetical protein
MQLRQLQAPHCHRGGLLLELNFLKEPHGKEMTQQLERPALRVPDIAESSHISIRLMITHDGLRAPPTALRSLKLVADHYAPRLPDGDAR